MGGAGTRIATATRAGVAFASEAWRDAWGALALVALGQATAFSAAHLDIPNPVAGRIQLAGLALSALALVPALGALYRSAVGGPALREISVGGLQVAEAERRVLGVAVLIAVVAAAALVCLLMTGAAVWYPLRDLGVVRLPVIGPFGLWFLAALPVLGGAGWLILLGLGRLSLLLPAAAAEPRWRPGRALQGSRRWSGSLAATTFLCDILPVLFLSLTGALIGWLERGQGLAGAVWPTVDAIGAGAVLAVLWAFVFLPLGVGARTTFYGRLLAGDRARRRAAEAAPATDVFVDSTMTDAPASVEEPAGRSPSEEAEAIEPAVATAHGDESTAASGEEANASVFATVAEDDPFAPRPVETGSPQTVEELPPARDEAEPFEPAAVEAPMIPLAPAAAEASKEFAAADRPAAQWTPPVAPVRGAALARAVTTPVLLAHANDQGVVPSWWAPPEHPEEPPVA